MRRQPSEIGDDGLYLCIWIVSVMRRGSKAPEHVRPVFFAQPLKIRAHIWRYKVAFQKFAGMRERIGEQDLVDKVNGRCRPLNIQKHT